MYSRAKGQLTGWLIGVAGFTLAGSLWTGATLALADNGVGQQIAQVMGQARSYQVSVEYKESGATVSRLGSSYHMDETVVRHGNVAEMYSRMTLEGHTVEMVIKGSKMCQGFAGHWECEDMGPQMGSLIQQGPQTIMKALGIHVVYKSAGTKSIAGHPAIGYTFAASGSGSAESGTLWLDPSAKRLVAMDAVSSFTIAGKKSTTSMSMLFTHWNDPNLKIPAIPGL